MKDAFTVLKYLCLINFCYNDQDNKKHELCIFQVCEVNFISLIMNFINT